MQDPDRTFADRVFWRSTPLRRWIVLCLAVVAAAGLFGVLPGIAQALDTSSVPTGTTASVDTSGSTSTSVDVGTSSGTTSSTSASVDTSTTSGTSSSTSGSVDTTASTDTSTGSTDTTAST
ncbi:MAG: hypothetical protein ACJ76M_05405, partial [Solirubrobacteraceae bacterium]